MNPYERHPAPSPSDLAYEAQGYRLPEGWTWELVAIERCRLLISNRFCPLGSSYGVTAWGTPFIDGKPLRYEDEPEAVRQIGSHPQW